ncbi:hypothetical protein [Streptomyces sp. NPDC003006]
MPASPARRVVGLVSVLVERRVHQPASAWVVGLAFVTDQLSRESPLPRVW